MFTDIPLTHTIYIAFYQEIVLMYAFLNICTEFWECNPQENQEVPAFLNALCRSRFAISGSSWTFHYSWMGRSGYGGFCLAYINVQTLTILDLVRPDSSDPCSGIHQDMVTVAHYMKFILKVVWILLSSRNWLKKYCQFCQLLFNPIQFLINLSGLNGSYIHQCLLKAN